MRAFVLMAVVCAGIAGFFWVKSLSGPDGKSQETEPAPDSMTGADSPILTQEEQIATLRRDELQLAEQLLRDFPKSDSTLAFVGSVYGQHGKNTEAVRLLNKALELNPNRPDVYNGLGWIAFGKGAYEEAVTHLRKASEVGAEQPGLRSSIAFSLMALGRHTEAIEELQRNVQVFPRSVYSHFLLGQAYLQQKDYQNAKEHYEAAIELDEDYVSAYYGLFTACSRLNQQAKAREYMAVFKKLKAEEMSALKARDKAYDDLVTMRQTVAENQITAARIYRAQGRSDRAEELLEKATRLDPDNPVCFTELAGIYFTTNRLSEALQMHRRVSEIEPQNPACS
jgi:tetratricopeptide (TPR) repeat protein